MRRLRVVDLTGTIDRDIWRYDDVFPSFSAEAVATIERDGFLVHRITLGTHMGTHTDAPAHLYEGGGYLETIPLDRYVGEAKVFRFPALDPLTPITGEMLEVAGPVADGAIALIQTGWSTRWGDPEYPVSHPYLTLDGAQWLLDRGVKCVGMDTAGLMDPRIDLTPNGRSESVVVDELLLRAGVPYIAGLIDLAELQQDRVWFSAFPMKIGQMDGAPVRAVAIEGIVSGGKEWGHGSD